MPVVQDPMGAASQEPGTIDHIRPTLKDRLKEERILLRVVFEVGILYDNHVACRGGNARPKRRTFAEIPFMIEYP